jgi:hypothetical protein
LLVEKRTKKGNDLVTERDNGRKADIPNSPMGILVRTLTEMTYLGGIHFGFGKR